MSDSCMGGAYTGCRDEAPPRKRTRAGIMGLQTRDLGVTPPDAHQDTQHLERIRLRQPAQEPLERLSRDWLVEHRGVADAGYFRVVNIWLDLPHGFDAFRREQIAQ